MARLALIAPVLLGLAAMHGGSAGVVPGGGHGRVSLLVGPSARVAHSRAHAAPGDAAGHGLHHPAGEPVATLGDSDLGSHHSLLVGCALTLTGIVTLALVRLLSRSGQHPVRRLGARRTRPRPTARLPRAGARPVPRFSLCVLRT